MKRRRLVGKPGLKAARYGRCRRGETFELPELEPKAAYVSKSTTYALKTRHDQYLEREKQRLEREKQRHAQKIELAEHRAGLTLQVIKAAAVAASVLAMIGAALFALLHPQDYSAEASKWATAAIAAVIAGFGWLVGPGRGAR